MDMLDRTNIHFKKAVKAVLEKARKGHIVLDINTDYLDIALFKDDEIFYHDMICDFHAKGKILQKLDNFNKMYYALVQLQKKGGRHE